MGGIIETVSNFAIYLIENLGYWGVFIGMTLESVCIPIPSEVIMPLSGFIAYRGEMSFFWVVVVGVIANLVGSWMAYFVGLRGGRPFLEKYGKYILISHKKLDMAHEWFEKYGHEAVLISRVLPVIRTFISLPAGIAEMDLKKFSAYTVAGSLPWCFALTYIGYMLGPNWHTIEGYFRYMDIIIVVGVVVLAAYIVHKHWQE
ncbi:MAG TPA: DedA family protein [Methanobacterium sp.]|jgi:membrane protein DedA with SNARE-associated domain|nr:MAG: DedA family protein [Methanobacterium sp.]HOI70707.1 DedA family protein [Methanobacterium sp.]HPX78647.1 DedA family protein [Methanobacterium sp.]